MPFQIVRNDITKVKADVIVNTANPEPLIGDGTDHAVYEAAGAAELLEARSKIGRIEPGQVAWTRAYGLDAKYIFMRWGLYGAAETNRRKPCCASAMLMRLPLPTSLAAKASHSH